MQNHCFHVFKGLDGSWVVVIMHTNHVSNAKEDKTKENYPEAQQFAPDIVRLEDGRALLSVDIKEVLGPELGLVWLIKFLVGKTSSQDASR